ncbi:hypothetical protein [Actinomycetospora cinnamomea]|uniref:Uncharacterized protein n=1 Tax=Actinomycetospora cinnamomea TaxID=663609 RepID=A0A2U1F8I6_9PSEU|nr:hypothetical protein [Actinomycetospora cinnamomea]PVZ08300.1 hypothetical protein C8D89_109187 [Actinomycetospora cinnamomea]
MTRRPPSSCAPPRRDRGATRPRPLRVLPALLVALVVALTGAGCGLLEDENGAPGLVVGGTVTVAGQPCPVPASGPVHSGTVVRVIDSWGALVSSAPLGPGRTDTDRAPAGCVLPFTVAGIPEDPDRYTVALGENSRWTQQVTTEQIRNNIPVLFVV